jgi:L-arabinose isomerase
MTQASARPRVGILALTLELYETLLPGVRQDREHWLRTAVLPALATVADVAFDRAAYTAEDVEQIVRGHEAAGCDALLVVCLTYSPSGIALPELRRTRLPIAIWNTQELAAVDEAFDGDKMLHNHGVHGTQDLSNVLLRSGVPFHYFTSHLADADALGELADFLHAAAATAALGKLCVGLIGYPFPSMGDFALDTTHLTATLGCRWKSISVEEYNERAAAASPQAAAETVAEYRRLYDLAGDLTEADLEAAARAELSLRAIAAEHRLQALSYQFMAFGEDSRTETLPFVGISRMMADGLGFAGEGDLAGAIGTWLLGRLSGPASFSEIFTVDFRGNALLLSHMGEANVALAREDRKIGLLARSVPITRTRGRQLVLATSFAAGPATLCALTIGPRGRWRLIASRIEIEDFGPLGCLPVPHSKIAPAIDVRQWLTGYAEAGGPHHHAICRGDARGRLRTTARLLDADYCEV